MITINLLPEEFRAAEKKSSKYPVIPIAIGAGVLFILLTIFFYFDYISANISLNKLNKESVTILPQSQRLKQLDTEVQEILKPENVFLNRFVTADRPATPMLSWVSEFLPPAAWLTGIARHRIIDWYRANRKRPVIELLFSQFDEDFSKRLFDLEAAELPDNQLEREEMGKVVEIVLSALPAEYEKVLRLRYLDERPVRDVALALDTTEKAAEARLYRARIAFRDAFRLAGQSMAT